MNHDEFLRFNNLKQITGLSRSTVWRLERAGQFPPRRQLALNCVGWLKSEIDDWVAKRKVAVVEGA